MSYCLDINRQHINVYKLARKLAQVSCPCVTSFSNVLYYVYKICVSLQVIAAYNAADMSFYFFRLYADMKKGFKLLSCLYVDFSVQRFAIQSIILSC